MITLDYVKSATNTHTFTLAKGEVRINCPECDDDKFHMYCNLEKMVYICHKCGARGKIKQEYKSDVSEFQEKIKITEVPINPIKTVKQEIRQVKNLPHCTRVSSTRYEAGHALHYLSERGITTEELNRYDIRVSLERSGIYRDTVIFPIYDDNRHHDDLLKYFVARKYDESSPKYVNAPWPKGDTIFKAYPNTRMEVVICEGIFDALAIARMGYNAIALLGKVATKEQLYRLYHNHKQLIIYLDFDAFTHAIQLKLQLMALGIKSEILKQTSDAADLYLKDKKQLEVELSEASKRLASITQ